VTESEAPPPFPTSGRRFGRRLVLVPLAVWAGLSLLAGAARPHFRLSYIPITDGDDLVQLLVVISDVTSERERERLQAEQAEAMHIFDRIVSDRAGFLEFFEEADDMVTHIVSGRVGDKAIVQSVAEVCHVMETRLDEEGEPPEAQELARLGDSWGRLKAKLNQVLDESAGRRIEVEPAVFDDLLADALRDSATAKLAQKIADLRLEPTEVRLKRVAEQAKRIARRLGKGDIQVQIDARTLRLEPRRWQSFWSAFVHVVRNAVDHGLEPPVERARLGKGEAGELTLRTAIEGDEFVISLADDGKGVDWEAVRQRARSAGLPAATPEDLERALFHDGLSTADSVTEMSGRGVGLGVVQAACQAHGGRVRVVSESGQGTVFEFRFPVHETTASPTTLLSPAAGRAPASPRPTA
jgi:two-component system, chemotaxis family, sensor kinase CheA